MASPIKPATDLLWAYQMKREHRYLSDRLSTLEATLTKQDTRIAATENSDSSAQDARITEISNQVRSLQETDVAERLAGLASELRETRQQTERTRDKLRDFEKTSKKDTSAAGERDSAVQERITELEHNLSLVREVLQGCEKRFELTAHKEITERLDEADKKHGTRFEGVDEQLRRLEKKQDELRTLLAEVGHKTHSPATISNPIHPPQQSPACTKKSTLRSAILPPPSLPISKQTQNKKRKLDREIAQLIHGDGSLTNAPLLFESQIQAPFADKKQRKALETVPHPQRETRSQAKRLREEPLVADVVNSIEQPTARRDAKATAKTTHRPQKTVIVRKLRETQHRRSSETASPPVPKLPLPLSSPSNDDIVVESPVASPYPSTPTDLPSTRKDKKKKADIRAAKGKAPSPVRESAKQVEQINQRPLQRRRRIEQDDSTEEFLAKCRAVTGT
ncbi:hypothetical protein Q7P37_001985 [Cladosporium fusiforme]